LQQAQAKIQDLENQPGPSTSPELRDAQDEVRRLKASLERARANPQTVSPTDNTALTQLQQKVEDLKAKIQDLENQPGPSTSPALRDAQDEEVRRLKASL